MAGRRAAAALWLGLGLPGAAGIEYFCQYKCGESHYSSVCNEVNETPLARGARVSPSPFKVSDETCTGWNDPPAWGCYRGSSTSLRREETVQVNLREFHPDWSPQKGMFDIYSWGWRNWQCQGLWFEKHGQDIYFDDNGCVPKDIKVSICKFCSDQNGLTITLRDSLIVVEVNFWLAQVTCTSANGNATGQQAAMLPPLEVQAQQDSCPPAPAGCSFLAVQPFFNEDVCNQYKRSNPTCDGTTRQCAEAANFQLVWTRGVDLSRTYAARDFTGVSFIFHPNVTMFVDGSQGFAFGREAVRNSIEGFYNETKAEELTVMVNKVLTLDQQGGTAIWSYGTSTSGTSQQGLAYLARFVAINDGHWVSDTLVVDGPASSTTSKIEQDPIFDAISARQQDFARLYNSGSYSQLVSELYADNAAFITTDGRYMSEVSEELFKEMPVAHPANITSKVVALDPSSEPAVAHEIGHADGMPSYYARWVQRAASGDAEATWVMEAHAFLGSAPAPAQPATAAQSLVV